MPSILHSKASLGVIPSPGTTCSKAWNKVFQILEQVIEGTPLFEPSKITVLQLQFQFLTSSKSLTLDRLQASLVCTRLNAIFSFLRAMTMTVMTVGVFIFLTVVLLVIYLL
jgi:hypothetical protein